MRSFLPILAGTVVFVAVAQSPDPLAAATVASVGEVARLDSRPTALHLKPQVTALRAKPVAIASGVVVSRRARVPLRGDPIAQALLSHASMPADWSDPAAEGLVVVALNGLGQLEVLLLVFRHGDGQRLVLADLP